MNNQDLDAKLQELQAEGVSILDAIKFVRSEQGVSLAEAKELVSAHPAYADVHRAHQPLHDSLVEAVESGAYLVVYDYGMGGVWAYVKARSEEEIVTRFPELKVVSDRPAWMSEDESQRLDVLDVDAPSGLLSDLLSARSG